MLKYSGEAVNYLPGKWALYTVAAAAIASNF
ncbi:MAG: hypothetical protein RL172_2783 [Bacteroidota bacterium]|jgi:hypothetical protein